MKKIPSGDFYNAFKKQNYQEFLDFDLILKNPNKKLKLFKMKKIKIICTIGPSSLMKNCKKDG